MFTDLTVLASYAKDATDLVIGVWDIGVLTGAAPGLPALAPAAISKRYRGGPAKV